MPISKANRALYPPDWKRISERTRDLAGNHCEGCGLPNHLTGYRLADGGFMATDGGVGEYVGASKIIRIVCTAAHVDHDPTNNHPSNLRWWCQRCHNSYDAPMRAKHAAETRRRKRGGQMELGGVVDRLLKTCTDCQERAVHAYGFCHRCYKRAVRRGDVTPSHKIGQPKKPPKLCPRCEQPMERRAMLCRACFIQERTQLRPTPPAQRSKPSPLTAPQPTPIRAGKTAQSECPTHHRPPVALLSEPEAGTLFRCPASGCDWAAWKSGAVWDVIAMPGVAA